MKTGIEEEENHKWPIIEFFSGYNNAYEIEESTDKGVVEKVLDLPWVVEAWSVIFLIGFFKYLKQFKEKEVMHKKVKPQ